MCQTLSRVQKNHVKIFDQNKTVGLDNMFFQYSQLWNREENLVILTLLCGQAAFPMQIIQPFPICSPQGYFMYENDKNLRQTGIIWALSTVSSGKIQLWVCCHLWLLPQFLQSEKLLTAEEPGVLNQLRRMSYGLLVNSNFRTYS